MLKNVMVALLIMLVSAGLLMACGTESSVEDILRIHIRANSNNIEDQGVKYKVKDSVVKYLTPKVVDCESYKQVVGLMQNLELDIEKVVDGVLEAEGFEYCCDVEIREEYFPTRAYEGCTLEANFYDALIINLGSGEGDNWWCVVYPPLCFKDTKNIVYKSKIMEIIEKYF